MVDSQNKDLEVLTIALDSSLTKGTKAKLEFSFQGILNDKDTGRS
jgi:hypothetical protein